MKPEVSRLGDSPLYLKALVYAYFGVGKTMFCGSAADHEEMRDVLLIRVEDGALTVRNKDIVTIQRIQTMDDMDQAFWAIVNRKKGFETIKTVIIDSATDLQQLCLEETVAENCKKNANKDPNLPSIHDWGQVNFRLTKMFRQFRDLPVHLFITALVRETYNTDDPAARQTRGPVSCGPQLAPTLGTRIMAFVDHVWSLHRTPKENSPDLRTLMTQPSKVWGAKTRGEEFAKLLGPKVENPSLYSIFETLKKTTKTKET
jgi:hypothetical protein